MLLGMAKIQCSNCGREFSAPFVPSPGRALLCGFCQLLGRDLSQSPFMVSLQAFLLERLLAGKGKVLVSRDGEQYVVIAVAKGKPAAQVCTAEVVPQNGADIPSSVPVSMSAARTGASILMPLIVNLHPSAASMRSVLAEFVKKTRLAGISAVVA